jgi:signal transduction histidine kinase
MRLDRHELARISSSPQAWGGAAVVLVLMALGQLVVLERLDDLELLVPIVAIVGPMAFVDRWPRAAVLIAVVGAVVDLAVGDYPVLVGSVIGLMVVCGTSAYHLRVRYGLAIAAPFAVNAVSPLGGDDAGTVSLLLLVLVVAALGFGDLLRSRQRVAAELGASVEAHEATSRERALLEERAHIARELHDVVAHHISSITVQAETARVTTPGLSELGAGRFAAISDSARGALDEMRRLLGVMRAPDRGADLVPQPGLDQLNALADEHRVLGGDVRLTVRGAVRSAPETRELVAYRVVQEALTNARRHAPGAPVEVALDYGPAALRIVVRDRGPGAAGRDGSGGDGGFGLAGMRERVEAVGGSLHAGDGPDGGFVVAVELPLGTA